MEKKVSKEWLKIFTVLNESQKRWLAANKSLELGYGGISIISRATSLSRTTQGIAEALKKQGHQATYKNVQRIEIL